MAKRRRRSRAKRKRPSLILIVALLVLVAGFITRRVLAPRAMHFLTHRSATPAPRSAMAGQSRPNQPSPSLNDGTEQDGTEQDSPENDGTGERLTDSDRRALDQVVRQRSGR